MNIKRETGKQTSSALAINGYSIRPAIEGGNTKAHRGARWEQPARRTMETAKDLVLALPSSRPVAAIFNDRSRGIIEAKKKTKRSLKIKKHLFLDSSSK